VTRPGNPAVVRFYFDADVLGLAKVLVQVRADVTYPGDPGGTLHRRIRPACPITSTAVKDDVWIPQVASLGWLIITRDSRIASKRAELAAVRETGARMVALSGPETVGTWAIGSALLSVARNRTPMRRAGPVHLQRYTNSPACRPAQLMITRR
jgi:hypothetical protein